ncbi:type IV pilin protein [Candidatus Omnitrophota bacterium]
MGKKKNLRDSIKAFTLIEVLIVVMILGILAMLALPSYNTMVAKAYVADAYIQLGAMARLERIYYLEYGEFLLIPYGQIEGFERLGFGPPHSDHWQYGFGVPYGGAPFFAPCANKRMGTRFGGTNVWYSMTHNEIHTLDTNPYPGVTTVSAGQE